MSRAARRVVKLGGSLLTLPELAQRLRGWFAEQPPGQNVLIVGGGELVEALRAIHRVNALDEKAAHWLCIRAMSVTAALVARLLPEALLVDRLDQITANGDPRQLFIHDVFDVLADAEPSAAGPRLPESWDVSSDSIAARIAAMLGAEELVLLKSATLPIECDCATAAREGYVDLLFPQFAVALPIVRWADLRHRSQAEGLLSSCCAIRDE